jgi:putative solute:sodium symporter small subunit
MTGADALRQRWRASQRMVVWLLGIWFVVTFVVAFFARDLNGSMFGWPFSFWVAAQGAPLVNLALVCVYARSMRRLDEKHGTAEDDER